MLYISYDVWYDHPMDETVTRMRKVQRIVAALDTLPGAEWESVLAMARRLTHAQWTQIVVDLMGESRPPSDTTVAQVIETLEQRLVVRRKIQTRAGKLWADSRSMA
jgi:hypothetical protein